METKILLIRHAESIYVNGQELGRPLSEKGMLDANQLAFKLKDSNIDFLYSSDYKRAVQTVEPLAKTLGLEVQTSECLRERKLKANYINLEYDDFIEAVRLSFDDVNYALEGGESVSDAHSRVIPFIENLLNIHHGKTIAIGSHGNIMTMILKYYDPSYGFDFWSKLKMPDVYLLVFNEKRLKHVERISYD